MSLPETQVSYTPQLETSRDERRSCRPRRGASGCYLPKVLSSANVAAELALVGINAALGQANFRRPPVRRLLRRRY